VFTTEGWPSVSVRSCSSCSHSHIIVAVVISAQQQSCICKILGKPFLDLEGGFQNATLVVDLLVVISSLKIPKAFLICSAAQLCMHLCAHIPY